MKNTLYFNVEWDGEKTYTVLGLSFDFKMEGPANNHVLDIQKRIIEHIRLKGYNPTDLAKMNMFNGFIPKIGMYCLLIPVDVYDLYDKIEKYTITLPASLTKKIDDWVSSNKANSGIQSRSRFLAEGALMLLKDKK